MDLWYIYHHNEKKEINGNRILNYLWIDSLDSYCLYNKLKAKISIILMSRNDLIGLSILKYWEGG